MGVLSETSPIGILSAVVVYFSFDFALNSFGPVLFITIELSAFEDLCRSVFIDIILINMPTVKD